MCEVCEHKTTKKSPLFIIAHWDDMNWTKAQTTDIRHCSISIVDESKPFPDNYKEFGWLFCPHCGNKLHIMPCETFKDVVEREG